jgi:hypothetical protein
MPKISSGELKEEHYVTIKVVLETKVPASKFEVYDVVSDTFAPAKNAEEVMQVLKYGEDAGTEPWAYTWEFDLWEVDGIVWELEVNDADAAE